MMAMVETLIASDPGGLDHYGGCGYYEVLGLHRREQLLARNTGGRILGALIQHATGITGITWLPRILPVRVLASAGS